MAFGATALTQETYLPEPAERLAQVYSLLQGHEKADREGTEERYFLSGSAADERVELPREIYQVLRQVVEAMTQNMAVTVMPQAKRLTTQQAAELLGVSRPTLVKLLETQQLPFERVGSHRRILLRDILAYRQQRRARQYAALAATAGDVGDEQDLDAVLSRMREARRAVAGRRRAQATD